MTFKIPSSLEDIRGVIKAAVHWYEKLPKEATANHPFAGVLPKTQEQAVDAYLISEFSLEPKFSQKQALTFVNRAGWAAFSVSQAIKNHWRDMETLWIAEATQNSKKNLSETSSEDMSLESAPISTESTETA